MICILQSIRHNWNEKIFALIKSIEARKNAPKCDLPAKVYIYEPIGKGDGCGKVVGEYTLLSIITDKTRGHDALFNAGACLTEEEAAKYANGEYLKGWVIENPVKYDTPKELSEFRMPCTHDLSCEICAMFSNFLEICNNSALIVKHPPQSWCYVRERKEHLYETDL